MYRCLLILLCIFSSFITAQVPNYVSTIGLQGWWPFCGNANDYSSYNRHGTVLGASLDIDRFGNTNNAYSLNGNTNSIYINYTFFDAGWSDYSISGWYYLNMLNNPQNAVYNHAVFNTSPHNGVELSSNWGASQKHSFLVGNGTPATSWNVLTLSPCTQTLTIGAWKHFVFIKSGTIYNLYIDGILDTSTSTSTPITSYLYKMYFGNIDPNVSNEGLNGKIDDYGIWNRVLSQVEITALYNGSSTCVTTTIIPTPTVITTPIISVLSLPNVITPNNDGVNDYIDFGKNVSETNFDFEIFNRWGLSIIKSNSNQKTIWDGTTTAGQKCVDGTYFYIIKTSNNSYKGYINLIK